MNTHFKSDQDVGVHTKSIKPYVNLYAGIVLQAIYDLEDGITLRNNNPRIRECSIRDRQLAIAWFNGKMPDALVSLDECLSVLKLAKTPLLQSLKRRGLL